LEGGAQGIRDMEKTSRTVGVAGGAKIKL